MVLQDYPNTDWHGITAVKRPWVPPWEHIRRTLTPTANTRDIAPEDIVDDIESLYTDLSQDKPESFQRQFIRRKDLDESNIGLDYDADPVSFKQYLDRDHSNMYPWKKGRYHVARIDDSNDTIEIHFFYHASTAATSDPSMLELSPKDGRLYLDAVVRGPDTSETQERITSLAEQHGYTIT